MNEIDRNQARRLATDVVFTLAGDSNLGDLAIIDNAIVETENAWYFPYDSVAFIEKGEISAALAGNLPVMVSKDGKFVGPRSPDDGM